MLNKHLIIIFLLSLLAISAVSAEDNSTDIGEIQDDALLIEEDNPINTEKQNYNASIEFTEDIAKYAELNDYYYLSVNGLPGDYDENADLLIDDDKITSFRSQGSVELHPFKYSLGTHTILVKLPETEKYFAQNLTKKFNVVKVAIDIPNEISTSMFSPAVVRIAHDATGSATVYVDGTLFKTEKIKQDEYGTYISLSDLEMGIHDVKITYSGDSKYPKTTVTKKVKVKYNMDVYVPGIPCNYGEDNQIWISLPSKVTSKPVVVIANKSYETQPSDENGVFYFNIKTLKPGYYNVTVIYPGDEKFQPISSNEKLSITPAIKIGYYYSNAFTSLNLPSDAEGNLTVYNNSNLFKNVKLVNGDAYIDLSALPVGNYNLTINYTGNDYSVNAMRITHIDPHSEYNSKINNGKIPFIYFKMNPEANGTWIYRFNGGGGEVNPVNGEINITFTTLKINPEEENFVVFRYSDGSGYEFEYDFEFTSIIYKPVIIAKNIKMYYCDGTRFKVTIYGSDGQLASNSGILVTFKIANKTYYGEVNEKGVASIKITELPGTYTIKTIYEDNYIASRVNTVVVKQILTLKKVKVKKSSKKLVLTATLAKKLKGKKITFNFNGKKYTAKTDKKGVAKVTLKSNVLKKLKVGKIVKYQATYLKNTVKRTVKVAK